MPERGYLVIADITGYTRFLTGSELDHAQGVLEDLFAVILERLRAPLTLSNVQGDAFFAFSNDAEMWSPGEIFDCIEALYFGFRDRLAMIVANTTCQCRACSNAGQLDLKFVVHHGEYVSQPIAGRQEVTGPDVILLHRLLKNEITERTGVTSYTFFTSAAVAALGLEELNEDSHRYASDLDEFGRVEGIVIDLGERWDRHHAQREIVVADDELWMEPVSRRVPFDIETVWTVYWDPEHRTRWNGYLQSAFRVRGDPKRLRAGAVDHCAHGKETFVFQYIDVRPLKHVTLDVGLPMMGGRLRRTVSLSQEDTGSRITVRLARAKGPDHLRTVLVRCMCFLWKKQIRAQVAGELAMLEQYIVETAGEGRIRKESDPPLSQIEITKAARGLASG